ncbi:MAG: hypothetical protein EHM24_28600 [Acidobacteria bacterium]|nr:MAG: hypothetical protein EHM24_28600 [Acidobacteriota bacterium]
MRTVLVVVLACLILTGAATNARDTVGLRVNPSISLAPATVRVVVTVEPDSKNRELVLEADSGLFFTSSTVQLDGDKAPRTQSFVLKELPAGIYRIAAQVVQRDGNRRLASSEYTVLE